MLINVGRRPVAVLKSFNGSGTDVNSGVTMINETGHRSAVDAAFELDFDGRTPVNNFSNIVAAHSAGHLFKDVRRESYECIEKAGLDGGFILSSGCEIPRDTPDANTMAMGLAGMEFWKGRVRPNSC